MINIKTAYKFTSLAALAAVGIVAGFVSAHIERDPELAKIKNEVEWQGEQIQQLKDVFTEEIFDKE